MDEEPPRGMAWEGEAPRVPACVQQKPGPPEQPGPGRASLSHPGDGHWTPESVLDLEDEEGAGGWGVGGSATGLPCTPVATPPVLDIWEGITW